MTDLNTKPGQATPNQPRGLRWAVPAALVSIILLTIALYWPRMHDFFLSDDFGLLWGYARPGGLFVNNGWITGNVLPVQSFFRFMPSYSVSGLLIYGLAGLNPLGWHLANLLLHLLNVFLVVRLVRRVSSSDWAALGAGALFAVHYIHAESVIWISSRTVLLVTFFILSALVVETRPRDRRWGAGRWVGLTLALLAFLSKEDSVVLPFLLSLIPESPMTVWESLNPPPGWLRADLLALWVRIRKVWPYWVLAGVYFLTRLGAVTQATHEQAYRLELSFNVIKNTLFVFVANLFPVDFRSGLDAWNRWYKAGDHSAALQFAVAHPGVIVAVILAAAFWLATLLWANRAARRLTLMMIVAAGPILFFRGTGERLLYLSSVGAAGAIALLLAGWHPSFQESLGRIGKNIASSAVVLLVLLHFSWSRDSAINWESASQLSRTIVTRCVDLGPSLPHGATIQLTGLPDNVKGAWVFRSSIEEAFRLYGGRSDVTIIGDPSELPDSARASLLRFRWDGEAFAPTE